MKNDGQQLNPSNRSCFVISPIGSPDSLERKQADEFLGLVKEVGELHGLEVQRADEIVGSNDINADVIERIQQSELCIIDLTGLNPNVMYEFGMRCQTNLPYIVCAKEGTRLPFDTVSRRTIFYGDISMTGEVRRVREMIRSFIRFFEDKDYQSTGVITTNDIYEMLQRILKKMEEPYNSAYLIGHKTDNHIEEEVDDLLRQLTPSEAFHYAYTTNNVRMAEGLLEYCREQPFEFFFNKLCALATLGSKKAQKELEKYLEGEIATASLTTITEAIGALVTCYNRQDSEKEHIDSMEDIFEKALEQAKTNKERASILNQKGRLLAGAQEYIAAQTIADKVIELNDEEPSYFYNNAILLKKLDNFSLALKYAKKAVQIADEDDADHLSLACELLKETNDPINMEIAQEYMNRLERISPLKARLLRMK